MRRRKPCRSILRTSLMMGFAAVRRGDAKFKPEAAFATGCKLRARGDEFFEGHQPAADRACCYGGRAREPHFARAGTSGEVAVDGAHGDLVR